MMMVMILLFRRALITDQVKDADDRLRAYLNYGNLLLSTVGITSGGFGWFLTFTFIRALNHQGSLVCVVKLRN